MEESTTHVAFHSDTVTKQVAFVTIARCTRRFLSSEAHEEVSQPKSKEKIKESERLVSAIVPTPQYDCANARAQFAVGQ
jgi:hypothetical protein